MSNSDPPEENESPDGDAADADEVDFSEYNLPTDLTAFQVHLLYLIYRLGPAEGVTLQSALEELYPEDINQGRFYPSLDRLVEAGLINKQTVESDKRRKEYSMTGRGEWVAEESLRFAREMLQ